MVSKIICKFILNMLIAIYNTKAASLTDISRLRKDLLTGYDPHSRPIQTHQNATVVKFDFLLKGFDLDERSSTLNVYAWTVLIWKDEHMKWDPANYGNLTRIQFPAHELWQPDFTVYNNLDKSEIDHFGNTRLTVYNTSYVVWVPPTKFQVPCQTDLRKWPYDQQTCLIIVGSWVHDGTDLEITIPINATSMNTDDFKPNREWDLVGTTFQNWVWYYYDEPGVPYPDLRLTITMARKASSHTACIVVPGIVIAFAVLIAFWIPPGSIERLFILLVAIIINVLYLYNIYNMFPNNGDSVPLVLLFYRDSLIMLAFALVWTIKLRYLAATKRNSPVPLPGFIQGFLESLPAKILCLDPRPSTGRREGETCSGDTSEQSESARNDNSFGMEKKNPFQEDWAWLAHLLDRVVFMIYLVVYTCFYLALL